MHHRIVLKTFGYFNILFLYKNIVIILVCVCGLFNSLYQIYDLINRPEQPTWNTVNVKKVSYDQMVFIYYYPRSYIVNTLLNLIQNNRTIKELSNRTNHPHNIFTKHESLMFIFYILSINDISNLQKVTISKPEDIKKIKLKILINKNAGIMNGRKAANYLNAIKLIGSAFSNKLVFKGTIPHEIFLGGLPDDFDRPLVWPGIYLLFLYGLTGFMVINFHKLDKAYQYPFIKKRNLYLKMLSLILMYNFVGSLINLLFIPNMMFLKNHNVLTKWSFKTVFLIFTLSLNTSLFTAAFISLINGDLHTMLYGSTIFIAPQILYIYNYGSDLTSLVSFQYYSSILPTFLTGWFISNIENYQTYEISKFAGFHIEYKYIGILSLTNVCFWIFICFIIYVSNQVKVLFLLELILKNMKFCHQIDRNRLKKVRSSNYDIYLTVMDTSNISIDCDSLRLSDCISNNNIEENSVQETFTNVNIRLIHSHSSEIIHRRNSLNQNYKIYCIITKNIWYFYGDEIAKNYVLKGFSMSARKNSITTIVGSSGSGKSTLIKILSGIIKPTQGILKIHKVKLKNIKNQKVFSQIAVYLEFKIKFNFLTVKEYLNLLISMETFRKNQITDNKTISKLAETLDIIKFLNKKLVFCPHNVVKLVEILSVFIVNASIILLDDPYKDLDSKSRNNLNALFIERKKIQTIIITTNQAENIETCTDKVILMDDGKSIFHTKLNNLRKENRMGFQLICYMERNAGDYSIIMFVKSIYPGIIFELSLNHKIYFQIPHNLCNQLSDIRLNILKNANRCGIAKLQISRMNLQSYFNLIFHDIHKKLFTFEDHINKSLTLTVMDKNYSPKLSFYRVYFKQFLLLLRNRYVLLYRFHNLTALSYFLPLLTVTFFMVLTFIFHPKSVFFKIFPDSLDEMTFGISNNITSSIDIYNFINNITRNSFTFKIKNNQTFNNFTLYLYDSAKNHSISYRNSTKIAVYFTTNRFNQLKIVILSNFENLLSKVYEKIQNYLLDYVEIEISHIEVLNLRTRKDEITEKNFILRLMYIAIIVFVNNLFNQKHQFHLKERNKFLKLVTVNYTLYFLPIYLIDIFQVLIFNSYIIMIVYMVNDFKFTVPDDKVSYLLLVLTMYGLADITYKTLIGQMTNFGPTTIFCFTLFDLMASFLSLAELLKYYLLFLKEKGYPLRSHCIKESFLWLVFLNLLIPSESLSNGLVSYLENPYFYLNTEKCGNQLFHKQISGSLNSYSIGFVFAILLLQWIVYFMLIIILNYPFYNQRSDKGILFKIKECLTTSNFCKSNNTNDKLNDKIIVSFRNMSYNNKHGTKKFENLNWDIVEGKISLILGPNQSGKSLITKLLTGYKLATSGRILFKYKFDNFNGSLSYCPQTPILLNELTVKEMFFLWSHLRCLASGKIAGINNLIMNELNLLQYSDIIIENLSKSTIKLVCLGISILGFPHLIVLDDPLGCLDVSSQTNVISLLKLAKFHKCSIILTANEIYDLYDIVDSVLILKNHKVLHQGEFSDAPDDIMLGYKLTFIFENDISEEELLESKILEKLELKLNKPIMINHYNNIAIYFISCKKKSSLDFSSLIIYIESMLSNDSKIIQYILDYSFNV